MKKFQSVRNGQVAELVSENEKQVIVKLESGEEKTLSPSTLKRWWKPFEEETTEEPQTEEVVNETTQEDAPAEEEVVKEEIKEEPKDEVKKEPAKPKTEKAPKQKKEPISGDHPLKAVIEKLATDRGTEVFEATVPSFRSLKVEGKMYMAFTFNKKGVTLWMRSEAIKDMTEFKKMNHMFDARVQFADETPANVEMITKLLEASLEFQKNKQANKKSSK